LAVSTQRSGPHLTFGERYALVGQIVKEMLTDNAFSVKQCPKRVELEEKCFLHNPTSSLRA
jgi:hypothetical protein